MSLEPRKVSEGVSEDGLGTFRGCLVEGDPEQRRRERTIRRRSLAISIVLQSTVLAALIAVSLFGKAERIAFANVTPVPPYSGYRHAMRPSGPVRPPAPGPTKPCRFCPPKPGPIARHDSSATTVPSDDNALPDGIGDAVGAGVPDGLIPLTDRRPSPPNNPERQVARRKIVHMTTIDPAMLIHRVEPVYPALAKQVHREGRVELRAVIGTDGSIQSLQIVAGDPLLERSAVEAVQQWRYKPTILNGQAVEIDTFITVIYTMPH